MLNIKYSLLEYTIFNNTVADVKTLPGYQEIPPNCPAWKQTMIEKKNRQLEDYAMV